MTRLVPLDTDRSLWADPGRVVAVDEDPHPSADGYTVTYRTTIILSTDGGAVVRWVVNEPAADIVARLDILAGLD